MCKLGDHSNITSIFEMDELNRRPHIFMPDMAGGDVEGLIGKAPDLLPAGNFNNPDNDLT
jgi:hypothetical protein